MPENVQNSSAAAQNANATSQSSSGPQAGDPNANPAQNAPNPSTQAPEPRGLKGSGLRYTAGDGVPSWAEGKTADEILALSRQMYDALQRNEPAPRTPAPSTSPPVTTPAAPSEPDPNLMYSNPAEYQRQLRAAMLADVRAEIASASGAVVTPLASLARSEAQRNPKRKVVWDRYAPEIEAMVARLPEQARARPDIWDEAAKMVAGEHVDEIARIEADRIIASGRDAGTLPTQHGSPNDPIPSGGSPLEKLFRDRDPSVRGFIDDGISIAKVREHARKQGYTEEAYAKLLTDRASWRVHA